MVEEAHRYGMGVTVVTNGTLLSRQNIERMFESGLDNLSISIDAASEETYAAIRGEDVFRKVVDGIMLLNAMKEERGRSVPTVVSVCTVMNQNIHELMEVVALCRQLKVAMLIFQPVVGDNTDQARADFSTSVFIPPDRLPLADSSLDALIGYKLESPANFHFIANSAAHLKLFKRYFRGKLKPQELPCYAGYNRVQVVQEGKLYFCVNQNKYEATFGDIARDNLRDLWYSKKARRLRRLIRACRFPCLQWCAYRDEFIELAGMLELERRFNKRSV